MIDLAGITIPAKVAYNEEYPTQNQENFAAFLLDVYAGIKASSQHTLYIDEDFYTAQHGFDADTMSTFAAASNAITAEIEDGRGVIGDLMDIAAALIPVQYRFIYYLAKPFLSALAEKFFHNLTDEGASGDLSGIEEKLASIESRLFRTEGENEFGLVESAHIDAATIEGDLHHTIEESTYGLAELTYETGETINEGLGSILNSGLLTQVSEYEYKNLPQILYKALIGLDAEENEYAILDLLAAQPITIRVMLNGDVEDVYFD